MTKIITGIDSGEKGAIAFINTDGEYIGVHDMPFVKTYNLPFINGSVVKMTNMKHIDFEKLESLLDEYKPDYGAIEAITGRESGGRIRSPASLLGQGAAYKPISYALYRHGFTKHNFWLLGADHWKKMLGVQGGRDKKQKTIDLIARLHPDIQEDVMYKGKVQDGRTDALAIAHCCLKLMKSKGVV